MKPSAAVVASLLIAAATTAKGELQFSPSVSLKAGYDSNPTLQADRVLESASVTSGIDLPLRLRGPRGGVDFRADLRTTNYDNRELRDAVEHKLSLNTDYLLRKTRLFGIASTARQNATLTEGDDTGQFDNSVDRISDAASVGLTHFLGPKWTLDASATIQHVEFDEDRFNRFFDFEYEGLSLKLTRRIGERTSLSARVDQYALEYAEIVNETDTLSYNLGIAHRFSQRWYLSAEAGLAENETSRLVRVFVFDIPVEESNSSRLADVRLTRAGDNTELNFYASARLLPSGNGELQRQLQARVSWKRKIGLRSDLLLSVQASRFEQPESSSNEVLRDFQVATVSFIRRASERMTIVADLRYRRNVRDLVGEPQVDATGLAAFVRFSMRVGSRT